MRILSIMLFAAALLTGSIAWAEDTAAQGPVSLQDCISTALQNNSDILTAKNNVKAAESRSTKAKSDYYPQVSIQNNTFTWGSSGVLNTAKTGTAITVSQNIYDGGLREANVQGAGYGVKQYRAGLNRTSQTVVYNVSKAYYEVLRARHLAEVAQANVKYNEGLRDQVQARADVGNAAKVDVLPIEAQLASARVSLLSAQNTVRTSSLQLQSVMGISSQPKFEISEVDGPPDTKIADLQGYTSSALDSRPDILQYRAATGAARASVRSAKVALYPHPTVTAEYQRQIGGGFSTDGTQVVGGMAFDVFDAGANRAAYREAQANRANAEVQEQQLGKDIRSQVEEAYLNLTSAKERVAASAVSLESAEKNYQAQQEKYAQGLGTTLDLLNAEVQVVTAQSDDVQARYDYYIAVAQMDYAVGK